MFNIISSNFVAIVIKYLVVISMTTVFIVLIIICIIIALAYAIGMKYERSLIYRQDNFPTPETGASSSSLLEPTGNALWEYNIPYFAPFRRLPFEEVEITAEDGLILRADLLRGRGTGVTVIFFHGYKSEPACDFAAMYDFYSELGCDLMYVHMRAHGKSEGDYIGFGALDRYDVVKWTEKAAELFPDNVIFLHGMSMGAASVLQSADLDLSKRVRGIIADCGYDMLDPLFRRLSYELYHIPGKPFVDIFEYVNLLKAGYSFTEASSARSVSVTEIPLLYICGDSDRYVPEATARRIFDACASEKQLIIVPGAGHAASYMCAKQEYQNAVRDFINKHK